MFVVSDFLSIKYFARKGAPITKWSIFSRHYLEVTFFYLSTRHQVRKGDRQIEAREEDEDSKRNEQTYHLSQQE